MVISSRPRRAPRRRSSGSSTSASTGSTCTTSGATRPSGSRSSAATCSPSSPGDDGDRTARRCCGSSSSPASARRRSQPCCWPTSARTWSASTVPAGRRWPCTGPSTTSSAAASDRSPSTSRTLTTYAGCSTWSPAPTSLVEGMRPGVAERLGVGPDDCLARQPSLVYGRMTGWGQDGPLADSAGHDITYVAVAGALGASAPPSDPPMPPLNLLGDFAGATYLVVGLLAALHESRSSGHRTGRRRRDGRQRGAPRHDVPRPAGGRCLAGPRRPQPARRRRAVLRQLPDLGRRLDGRRGAGARLLRRAGRTARPGRCGRRPQRPGDLAGAAETFADVFATRTRAEWTEVFAGSDACVAPVLGLGDATRHPHLAARGTFVEHAGVVQPAPAPRFSRTQASLDRKPPGAGQHTDEVLAEWLTPELDAGAPDTPTEWCVGVPKDLG